MANTAKKTKPKYKSPRYKPGAGKPTLEYPNQGKPYELMDRNTAWEMFIDAPANKKEDLVFEDIGRVLGRSGHAVSCDFWKQPFLYDAEDRRKCVTYPLHRDRTGMVWTKRENKALDSAVKWKNVDHFYLAQLFGRSVTDIKTHCNKRYKPGFGV